MKKTLSILSIIILFAGCTKYKTASIKCDWFPINTNGTIKYTRAVIGNNTAPYPTSSLNAGIISDNAIYFNEMLFRVVDCDNGIVTLKYYSKANDNILFDKSKSTTCCTATTVSTYNGYNIKQHTNGSGKLISELQKSSDSYPSLRVEFIPSKGITYIEEINSSNGEVTYAYSLN